MTKQHRMALMTIACLVTAVEHFFWDHGWAILITLGVIAAGCVVTIGRRARFAYVALETGVDEEAGTDA